ncbi:hypothetical protein FF1_034420 [Malus domestica]
MTQESPNNNIQALHARIYPSIEEFNKPNLQVGFSDEDASFFPANFKHFQPFLGLAKKIVVANLDPANDALAYPFQNFHVLLFNLEPLREFSYEHSVNLEDLIKLSDVMVEHSLGSNGDQGYTLLKASSLPQGMTRDMGLELRLLVGLKPRFVTQLWCCEVAKSTLELKCNAYLVVLLRFGCANLAVASFGLLVVIFAVLGLLAWYLSEKIKVFDHRGHSTKLCIVFLPLLYAALVGISRVMITESLTGRLRQRCIEECWPVLIFDYKVKLSSYVICEEQILRVQTQVHQSTSYWKKGEDPELSCKPNRNHLEHIYTFGIHNVVLHSMTPYHVQLLTSFFNK